MNDKEQHLCDELTTMVSEHGWEKTLTMLKQIAHGQATLLLDAGPRGWSARSNFDRIATDLHNAAIQGRYVDERNRRLT